MMMALVLGGGALTCSPESCDDDAGETRGRGAAADRFPRAAQSGNNDFRMTRFAAFRSSPWCLYALDERGL